jgi:DNA-directed RNA polymerase III subunit RPC3
VVFVRYIDLDKAFATLTRVFLKTLFNTMLRHEDEAREALLNSVLEKRSRIDVAEDPSLLTSSEREVLESWEKKSERYCVAETRIEQSLFILRDCKVENDSTLF